MSTVESSDIHDTSHNSIRLGTNDDIQYDVYGLLKLYIKTIFPFYEQWGYSLCMASLKKLGTSSR